MKLLLISSAILLTCPVMASGTDSEGPLNGMHFVSIPAGDFLIGSDIESDEYFDEIPQRTVQIKPFEIMTTEVTQGMWEELMGSDSDTTSILWTGLCGRGSDYPVYAVSWFDCTEFIERLNTLDSSYIYRLPGEAEWEYACRAGSEAEYFWGDNEDQAGIYCRYRAGESDPAESAPQAYGTRSTASLEANSWGLYDMAGNVSEWCQDRYSPDYDYLPADATPFVYPCDDQWPYQMNTRRVHRGGSWLTSLKECRSGNRSSQPPEIWATSIGFRLVRVPRTTENTALMLFHEGLYCIDTDADRDALELFTCALELDPSMLDALLYRAFFRYGLGETEESIADFYRAIELYPHNAGVFQMFGVVLVDAEYERHALKVLNRVVELDPDYPGIYYQRGFANLFLWNLDEAISDFTRAIEYNPGSPAPFFARGTAYFVDEQFYRALGDMEAAIDRNPADGDTYIMRSQIHIQMGNLEEARSDSIRAAELGAEPW